MRSNILSPAAFFTIGTIMLLIFLIVTMVLSDPFAEHRAKREEWLKGTYKVWMKTNPGAYPYSYEEWRNLYDAKLLPGQNPNRK